MNPDHLSSKKEDSTILVFPAIVLAGCILFNFVLCYINTGFYTVTTPIIIGCEIILIGFAMLYGFRRINGLKTYWVLVFALACLLILILSLLRGEILLKPLRDFIIMPVFIILGLSSTRLNLTKLILLSSTFITAIALLEAFFPIQFLDVFDFKNYFISKGSMEDHSWLTLNTFASGVRPGGRFLFDIPGVHRISSVFLEPVSLGFYAFIAAAYFICSKETISKRAYFYGLSLSFVLIWLSDARMALCCTVVALFFRFLYRRIDHRFSLLILPLFFLSAWIVNTEGLLSTAGEGIGARFSWTFAFLSDINLEIFLGAAGFEGSSPDSALGYIFDYTGFLGLLLYWLPPALYAKKLPERARIYLYAISFFLAFGFMVSSAIFTIKTAALLWFIYGYIIASDVSNSFESDKNVA